MDFLCLFSDRQRWLVAALFDYEVYRAGKRTPAPSALVGNVLSALRRRLWRALSEQEANSYAALIAGIEEHQNEAEEYAKCLRRHCGERK